MNLHLLTKTRAYDEEHFIDQVIVHLSPEDVWIISSPGFRCVKNSERDTSVITNFDSPLGAISDNLLRHDYSLLNVRSAPTIYINKILNVRDDAFDIHPTMKSVMI